MADFGAQPVRKTRMSEDLTCFLCHCETEHYTTSDSDLHMALVKTCRKSSDRQFLRSLYFNEKKTKMKIRST